MIKEKGQEEYNDTQRRRRERETGIERKGRRGEREQDMGVNKMSKGERRWGEIGNEMVRNEEE